MLREWTLKRTKVKNDFPHSKNYKQIGQIHGNTIFENFIVEPYFSYVTFKGKNFIFKCVIKPIQNKCHSKLYTFWTG